MVSQLSRSSTASSGGPNRLVELLFQLGRVEDRISQAVEADLHDMDTRWASDVQVPAGGDRA
jgi:hypothetical protein